MEFFIFLILFLCVFLPSWNILCSANDYIREQTEVVSQKMDSLDGIYQRGSKIVNRIDERLMISDHISQLKELAIQYPVTAFCATAVLATVSLPVITFLFFAFATFGVTFVGFLFVNGTVLTVAGVVFGSIVCVFGAVAAGFAAVVASIFYAFNYVVNFMNRFNGSGGVSNGEAVRGSEDDEVRLTNGHTTIYEQETVKQNGVSNGTPTHSDHNGWEKLD